IQRVYQFRHSRATPSTVAGSSQVAEKIGDRSESAGAAHQSAEFSAAVGDQSSGGVQAASMPRALRTRATWPVALTLYWASSTRPSASTTTVERMTPWTTLP